MLGPSGQAQAEGDLMGMQTRADQMVEVVAVLAPHFLLGRVRSGQHLELVAPEAPR